MLRLLLLAVVAAAVVCAPSLCSAANHNALAQSPAVTQSTILPHTVSVFADDVRVIISKIKDELAGVFLKFTAQSIRPLPVDREVFFFFFL